MLLLLFSFSSTLLLYFFIQSIIQINDISNRIHESIAQSCVRKSDCRLEAVNIACNTWTWIPVFIRVYLIGIFETVYIAICKRGLFKDSLSQQMNEHQVDTLIQSYQGTTHEQIAVITGGDSGIGLEICRGLLEAGFRVIIGENACLSVSVRTEYLYLLKQCIKRHSFNGSL